MRLNNINNGDIVGLFEKAILAVKVDGQLMVVSPKEIGIVTKYDKRLNVDVEESNEIELLDMLNKYEGEDNFSQLCKRMMISTLEKNLKITEIFNSY